MNKLIRDFTVIAGILAIVPGCTSTGAMARSDISVPKTKERPMKSSSRKAPPAVAPVEIGGVRYAQLMSGALAACGQHGGCLAAYDTASDERIWTLVVYENKRNPDREGDVQDVFFRAMTLEGSKLRIENERGRIFLVDPETREVEEVSG